LATPAGQYRATTIEVSVCITTRANGRSRALGAKSPATLRLARGGVEAGSSGCAEGRTLHGAGHSAIRADLLRRLGRDVDASAAYDAAIQRTDNAAERDFLRRRRQSPAG
jgi:hypothetical protein